MRKWATRLLVVALLGAAGFLIYRALTRYTLDEIVSSVASIPLDHIGLMAAFAAASYLCLTVFDVLGLHYVGRPLPYWRTALTSFTALSIGHNVGFAALSSGAIRYRLYSEWGLSTQQVAKLILFCAFTVGLGLVLLGGVALLAQPDLAQEVTRLERPIVLALGTGCVLATAAYLAVAAFVRRSFRFRHWSMEVPNVKLALGQAIIGPVNFAFVAACLYQALAATAEVSYLGVATVYVIANVATLISHVPGGLGVIESVVLFLLPGEQLIGALIMFRVVYFLVPLCLGSTLFAVIELLIRTRRRAGGETRPAVQAD